MMNPNIEMKILNFEHLLFNFWQKFQNFSLQLSPTPDIHMKGG